MLPLIDGDIVMCRAGFAAESRYYTVGTKEGGQFLASFKYKKEVDEFLKEYEFAEEEVDVELVRDAEPFPYARQNVDNIINHILERCQSEDYIIYMTGPDNFRKEIDPEYKAHRDPKAKPILEKELTEYMVWYWGADVCNGIEADDAMAIDQMQKEEDTCICTIDKDLDMIPGHHFNFVKDEFYWVEPEETKWVFLEQLMVGDTVDNIHGLVKVGPKTAQNILCNYSTPEEALEEVKKMYESAGRLEDLYKNAQLLWIQQKVDDDWKEYFQC